MFVADLINWETRSWNFTLLHELFNTEDIKVIKTIPIRHLVCQDRMVRHYTKNGSYTVKSGYQIAKAIADMEEGVPSTSGNPNKIWNWLWHLRVPPKVQTFVWRCIHGALPTFSNLMRKRTNLEPGCRRCGTTIETPEHALRDCQWASFLWAASPLRIVPDENLKRGTIADWINSIMDTKDQDLHDMFVMILWIAWHARNKFVYQNHQIDHKTCLDIAMHRLSEFHSTVKDGAKISLDRVAVFSEKWIPPMEGFVKINCDTSIRENIGTGTGAIIRDNSGKALTAAHRLRSEELEVDVAEAFACLDGLLLAKDAGYSKVILETDNTTIYFKLKKMDRDFSYLGGIISDILDLFCSFEMVIPSCVKRSGNFAAHHLARNAFVLFSFESVVGEIPNHVERLLREKIS
ncbi:hypothetical protein DH2020_008338 [Rehmannia glutinosa]|uniref:Uncharacterized protein n=1 Tax=Rehmannia glutinosa TaxID=99300 RepID=A0ABR0U163_REHGL